jgi:hypothetical protein
MKSLNCQDKLKPDVMKVTFTFILSLFSITSFSQNCVFIPEKDCINDLRIYIDREGYLYPPSDVYQLNADAFYFPSHDKRFNRQHTAKLKSYFERNEAALGDVCDRLGIAKDYVTLQDFLFQAYADRINQEVQKGNRIVFLVHGFNNFQEEALASFYLLKHKLNARYKSIAFVEVYWDGLANNAHPKRIWKSAQVNSSYAGLGIRRLLNKVNKEAEIVLLSHSLGASVVTQALFNVSKWKGKFQKELDAVSNTIPTPPQKSITLCMLVPAIPGENTFDDLNRTVINNTTQHISKIVVGYNWKDKALSKKIGIRKKFGSTSLGSNAGNEVFNTRDYIEKKFPDILFKETDLQRKPMPKEHSIAEYMRSKCFNQFLDDAFK